MWRMMFPASRGEREALYLSFNATMTVIRGLQLPLPELIEVYGVVLRTITESANLGDISCEQRDALLLME